MKLKNVFFLPLLLAFALAAGAQTNSNGGATPPAGPPPQTGTQLVTPRVRSAPTLPVPARAAVPPAPTTPAVAPAEPADPAAASATLGANTPPATARPEPADISYNLPMPVAEVLGIYANLVGRTPLHTPAGPMGVPDTGIITLKTQSPLTHSEAIQALETILGMNGITIVPIGDKFFKVVSEVTAPISGGEAVTNSAGTLPTSGKFITEIVQLKYADPQQVVDALSKFAKSAGSIIFIPSTQSLILRDYTENVKRMLEMLEKIDVSSPLIVKPRVIPIKYALATDIASALSQLGAGAGGSVGKNSSGANFKTGTTGSSSAIGGGPGGSTIPGQSTQTGLSAGAGGSRSNFGARLGQIVATANTGGSGGFSLFGQTRIIADERTNSLLVFANDDDMKMIEEIINKLDVVLAQVLIEAVILEVNLAQGQTTAFSVAQNQLSSGKLTGAGGINNLQNAGSFLQGASGSTNGGTPLSVLPSLPGAGQFTYFGKYGNDLDMVLEAVASDSRISVLSRPRIQTSHAVEAELFIGNTVPYVTGTVNYGYGAGPSSQYTEKEVGIRLRVLPLINNDGLVVMDIDQEIEQLGPSVQIEGVGAVPTTTKRDAGAKVAVYSGQTIILGGFISASRQNATSGVPWLKDIPVLGNLFKSTVLQNTRTELIVLMRPTVLPNPQIAARVAMDEKHKMAAVERAELEIRADEDKRNAVAAAELEKAQEKALKKAGKSGTNAPVNLDLEDDNTQTNSPAQSEPKMP